MRRKVLLLALLAAAVFPAAAFGFDAYFADSSGQKIGTVWEGESVYVVVEDPDKGACGIDEFQADLVIFDFKTGAYIWVEDDPNTAAYEGAWFREVAGAGTAKYFWVTGPGSTSKVAIPVGSRADFGQVPYGQTHVLGQVSPAPVGVHAAWEEGAWEYVDEDVLGNNAGVANTGFAAFPESKLAARVDFEGLAAGRHVQPGYVSGRLENMDTLVLIVSDATNKSNIDQDQAKIQDTVGVLTVTPHNIYYGCEGVCGNITVRIVDPDENLSCDDTEYVPFFVIVNPGGWNPEDSEINNFCALMMRGGYVPGVGDLNEPIRWYNIYDEPTTVAGVASRYIQYPASWLAPGNTVGRALFFASETGANSGEFVYNFGNIEDLQNILGFRDFTPGTTIAFYYIDPNDFDDMSLATVVVGDGEDASETYITNVDGQPVDEVQIGNGGLYVRVYDGDANVEACCQDSVVVHLCDPHNEDDSEYWVLDEVLNDSGVFATKAGMALLPVWDATGGYQLVLDNWTFEAFNEDTIYVRYNSVDYEQADLNLLGDFSANDGAFPPRINEGASRNQPWDVSFDSVKVYDTQVFDGSTTHMRFLNGAYEPVSEIPVSGSLYLEVVDPDQNEDARRAELIRAHWNCDATAADDQGRTHSPRYDGANGLPDPTTLTPDAGEDSAPIWWLSGAGIPTPPPGPPAPPAPPGPTPPPPPSEGDSDIMTPAGLVDEAAGTPYVDPYLGGPQWTVPGRGSDDVSITGIPETVKVFIWNAQNGNWEAVDLKETGPDTGVFRSTTCVYVSTGEESGISGYGNLGSSPGDTIMAFYQDPSNHSDISIISIKVSKGGAGEVVPPAPPQVAFDATQYNPGDTVTITVTDPSYAGQPAIEGTNVLVLKDATGQELASWDSIPALSGTTDQFRVSYTLPEDVVAGTITAIYTDPAIKGRTAQATATVLPAELTEVKDISVAPNPFSASTTFSIVAEPSGAKADKITVTIYDLLGKKVDEVSGEGTDRVTWTGGSLRNGAYIYVAVVEGAGKTWTFRGFVYIKR